MVDSIESFLNAFILKKYIWNTAGPSKMYSKTYKLIKIKDLKKNNH